MSVFVRGVVLVCEKEHENNSKDGGAGDVSCCIPVLAVGIGHAIVRQLP